MRKLFDSKAGATFHAECPDLTINTRKDGLEFIAKLSPGIYLIINMKRRSADEVLLYANWGDYFNRLQNPDTQLPRIKKTCPTLYAVLMEQDKDNVFQVCFTDPNQGVASADYIAENALATKVAVIYKNDDAYSTGIYNKFTAEAAVKGVEIVYTGTFTEDTQNDFSVQLSEAQKAGADLVFLPIYFTPASLILQQADAMGYAPKFFGVDGMDGILGIKGFDTSLAEGVYLLTPFSADGTDDATVSFVTKYQELYKEVPNQFAADAYDAVYTVYEAITKAGVTGDMSAEEICEALIPVMTQIQVNGLTGTMTWQATGEVSKSPMAVIIKDGVYVGAKNAQ